MGLNKEVYKYSVNFINEEFILSRLGNFLPANQLITPEQVILQELVELRQGFQIQNAEALVTNHQ